MTAKTCSVCNEREAMHWSSLCLPCKVEYNYQRRHAKGAVSYPNSPEKDKEYRRKFPERNRAYLAVNRALKSGALQRPSTCEKCGVEPAPRRNGASGIEGHHHDYSKQLDVTWLCGRCHTRLHR